MGSRNEMSVRVPNPALVYMLNDISMLPIVSLYKSLYTWVSNFIFIYSFIQTINSCHGKFIMNVMNHKVLSIRLTYFPYSNNCIWKLLHVMYQRFSYIEAFFVIDYLVFYMNSNWFSFKRIHWTCFTFKKEIILSN